jgi:hypothetical protein
LNAIIGVFFVVGRIPVKQKVYDFCQTVFLPVRQFARFPGHWQLVDEHLARHLQRLQAMTNNSNRRTRAHTLSDNNINSQQNTNNTKPQALFIQNYSPIDLAILLSPLFLCQLNHERYQSSNAPSCRAQTYAASGQKHTIKTLPVSTAVAI